MPKCSNLCNNINKNINYAIEKFINKLLFQQIVINNSYKKSNFNQNFTEVKMETNILNPGDESLNFFENLYHTFVRYFSGSRSSVATKNIDEAGYLEPSDLENKVKGSEEAKKSSKKVIPFSYLRLLYGSLKDCNNRCGEAIYTDFGDQLEKFKDNEDLAKTILISGKKGMNAVRDKVDEIMEYISLGMDLKQAIDYFSKLDDNQKKFVLDYYGGVKELK